MDTIDGLDGIKQAADKANALVSMLGLAIDPSDNEARLVAEMIGDKIYEISSLAEKFIRSSNEPLKDSALDTGESSSAEGTHIQLVN